MLLKKHSVAHLFFLLTSAGNAVVCLAQVNFPGALTSSSSGLDRSSLESSECCFPAAICSSLLFSQQELAAASCRLPGGERGLCCPDGRGASAARPSTRRPFNTVDDVGISSAAAISFVSDNELNIAVRRGRLTVDNVTRATANFGVPVRNSAAFFHARFQSQSEDEVAEIGRSGLLLPEIALELIGNDISTRQSGLSNNNNIRRDNSAVNFGDSVSGRQIVGDRSCPAEVASQLNCRGASLTHRTADGTCNNLREPAWGKSKTALNRLLLPSYADGIQAPRIGVTGSELPSARLVSTRLARDLDNPDSNYAVMVMPFGQFVDHDLDHAPIIKSSDGQDIDCCSSSSSGDFASICYPIQVPGDDPFFRGDKSCINLVRSTPAPALDCSVRYREQLNQVTHWLDLSQVYGSSATMARDLRVLRGGRLRVASGPDGQMLPDNPTETACTGTCFKAGDGRVNEQPSLNLVHHIFMREHNRVADRLAFSRPELNDEQLYQEARRIVVGEYQHILYNEWLPIILGKQYMTTLGLFPLSSGYSRDYDPSVDPRINNEFAAAGMRFGHSLIPGLINVYNRVGQEINPSFQLRQAFLKPDLLRLSGMVDGLIAGLTRDRMQQFDSGFTEDITNHLFDGDRNGMDLIALNIQRAREHGIPGYNSYRELCNMGRARSFADLSKYMSFARAQELQDIYENVDDVDLFVGMFSERPMNGALVGPITLCIVGDQFARLKKGDRLFYDLGQQQQGQGAAFTEDQLNEIRKASLARILCDNSGIGQMQPLAFQLPTSFNPIISCSDEEAIPRVDLSLWGGSGLRSGN